MSYAADSFRVGKNPVVDRPCKFYPYYTPPANWTRLYEGIFQQEPAIAELERLFTPILRSSKYMFVTPVRTSIPLSGNFILPKNRSPGFRSAQYDLRRFRLAFASVTPKMGLASPYQETPWPVLRNVRYNPAPCGQGSNIL